MWVRKQIFSNLSLQITLQPGTSLLLNCNLMKDWGPEALIEAACWFLTDRSCKRSHGYITKQRTINTVVSPPWSYTLSHLLIRFFCLLLVFSYVVLNSFATLLAVACQAPLSVGLSRREYWSGLPLPPPGDLPHPGTELVTPVLAGRYFTTEPPGKPFLPLVLLF